MNALVINDLTKKFDSLMALRAINLELPEGRILGLVGPQGAGKTTLAKVVCGLTKPTLGSASVCEYSCSESFDKLHKVCGTVLDDALLYGRMTAMENIVFFAKANGLSGQEAREQASELFHGLGIWSCKDLAVQRLTPAAYKKLCVAIALVARPKLLILDDIGEDLDDRSLCEIYDFIRELADREGLSAMIASETGQYMDFCDTFAILSEGQILSKGSYAQLMKNAEMKFRASLKTADGELSLELDGFTKTQDGTFEKEISGESEMTELIERAVNTGNKLLEAKVTKPNLMEIYHRFLYLEDSQ